MKKSYITILLIAFATFNTCRAQYATIPDPVFVSWLQSHGYAGCMNGNQLDTTCSTVASAVSLNCYAVAIHDLSGLQYFKNLDSLDCSNDSLYYIPALPSHIIYFNCNYNNLDSLPALPQLTALLCSNNNLTAVALPSPLTYVDCSFNKIRSLPTLPSGLRVMFCLYDSLTALPPLPPLLAIFGCSSNRIAGPFPTLPPNMGILECDDNLITSIPPLGQYMQSLTCEFNPFTSPLPTLTGTIMYQLDCRGDNLTSIPTLPATLTQLGCGYNYNLHSLPMLPPLLQGLSTDYDPLDSLPVLPQTLQQLNVQGGHLTSLPALPNGLVHIDCQYNQLTSIPPLPDTMSYFRCTGNTDLYCLPELKTIAYLEFTNTGITCLPNYGTVTSSLPALDTVPLCGIFNPGGCQRFWNISGEIYYDANTNCIFDSTDAGQEYVKVQLASGNMQQQVYSSYGGGYSFLANQNTNYNINIDTTTVPFVISCPANNTIAAVVTPIDSESYNNSFAFKCRPDGVDVGVQSIITHWANYPRPTTPFALFTTAGDISQLYGAHCAAGSNVQVQLIYTGQVTYNGVLFGAITPTSVSGDTITWNVADLDTVNDRWAFNTIFTIDSAATPGTQVCFTVHVTTNAPGHNYAETTGYYCFTIVNALDPNEKEVSPAGNIDTAQKWLTYTIRFQNTGTAPAQNIRITDTLDSHLDPSTFQLTAYSAKNLTQLFDNAVIFNFPNINLPDSLTGDSASRGFVQYKIKLKDNLPWGTSVSNTANIYFDLNSAVVTNTTKSYYGDSITGIGILCCSLSDVTLYPNPAHDYVMVSVNDNFIGSQLMLTDDLGRTILTEQITGSRLKLETGALAKGIYLVKVSESGVGEVVKKLVIE